MARTVLLALCLLGVANAQDHGHDHDSVEVCGCAAKEEDHPFSTDCKNKTALAASWKALSACEKSKKGCQESKDSKGMMVCKGAFFHLQFAHDWCPHDTLTEAQEKGIHDWEDYCVECAVSKPYNPKFKDCVKPKCEDASVAKKAFDTLKAKCTEPKKCCKTTEQKDAWTTVMSYHDLCDHDDVPEYIEKAYHDYEEACEDFGCNSVDKGYDGTKCPSDKDEDHGHDHDSIDHLRCCAWDDIVSVTVPSSGSGTKIQSRERSSCRPGRHLGAPRLPC